MNQEQIMQQLRKALQAHQDKDLDTAETIFKKILAVNPKESNALHLLGCIYKDRGQLKEAIDLIKASIRENDSNPIPYLNLGKILVEAGQHEDAAVIFQESLKRSPQISETWFCFGNALRVIEKVQEAKQAYRNAIRLNYAHVGAASNLGALLTDDCEWDEAEELFSKAIEYESEDVNLRVNYGKLLAEKGDYSAAIVQYRIALSLAPRSPELHYNFANSLKEAGEFEEAIENYRKAIKLKPDFADSYYQLYLVINFSGDNESALIALQACLEADANHYNARQAIGFAFFQANRRDDAIQYFSSRVKEFDFVYWVHLFRALDGKVPAKLLHGVDLKSLLVEEILSKVEASDIAALGDSHVNVFKDIPGISVNYLGAATAYNLSSEKSSSGGGRLLKEKLVGIDPKTSAILLCFGEIDCRAHIVKQAYLQKKSIKDVAVVVAKAYFELALSIKNKGFSVIIYAPHGSGSQFNSFGLEAHRNLAVKFFNCCLQEDCLKHDVYFFSLFNLLVEPASLLTRRTWLKDDVHLPKEGHLSDQVKVLLLSQLLLEIQSREQSLNADSAELGNRYIRDVRAFGVSYEGKCSQIYAFLSEDGLIQWQPHVDDSINNICFDLGSSIVLSRALVSLKSEIINTFYLEFAIDGVEVVVSQTIDSSDGRIVVDFPKETMGRFLTVSGYKSLSDMQAISFISVFLQVE